MIWILKKYIKAFVFFVFLSFIYFVAFIPDSVDLIELIIGFAKFQIIGFLYSSFLIGIFRYLNLNFNIDIWK